MNRRDGQLVRIGGWLFRRRTVVPVPLALAVLLIPAGPTARQLALVAGGVGLVAAGEAVRLWGVRHIGAVSRTRSERLGPLVDTGPFAHVRNPLYIGNVALWAGFAVAAGLPWLAPVLIVVLAFEYHAIVRWEEHLLEARVGEPYRAYVRRIPRWLPALGQPGTAGRGPSNLPRFSWRDTLHSERGTLIGIAVGLALLWFKAYAFALLAVKR